MKAERLARLLEDGRGFDTETHLVQPGLVAPPLVCGSFAVWNGERFTGALCSKDDTLDAYRTMLDTPRTTIVGAKICFDNLVMAVYAARRGLDLVPAIFGAYEDGRFFDVQIAEGLHAIAIGRLGVDTNTGGTMYNAKGKQVRRYSLDNCTRILLGRTNAKANDRWRMSYALLENVPMAEWPGDAKIYPVDDAVNTLEVGAAQCGLVPAPGRGHRWPEGDGPCLTCGAEVSFGEIPPCRGHYRNHNLHELADRCYTHWSLYLGGAWGLTPDPSRVAQLEAAVRSGAKDAELPFVAAGILRPVDKDGKYRQNQAVLKRRVAVAYGAKDPCPRCTPHTQAGLPLGRVPNPLPGKPLKRGGFSKRAPIRCELCDGTGLTLTRDVPRTVPTNPEKTPGVGKGRDPLTESGDDTLIAYAAHTEDAKLLTTYLPWLKGGEPEAEPDEDADDESEET